MQHPRKKKRKKMGKRTTVGLRMSEKKEENVIYGSVMRKSPECATSMNSKLREKGEMEKKDAGEPGGAE